MARTRGPGAPDPNTYTPEEAERLDRELTLARLRLGSDAALRAPVTVPVAVHVIADEDGSGSVSDTRVKRQVSALERTYSGERGGADTGFRFRLAGVDVTRNDRWFNRPDRYERHMKRELREGGPETLNIYTADLGGELLGWATLPQRYRGAPEMDGVVVDHRSLPGGAFEGFDLGHTAVHEAGHWLALFHTFQNGCVPPGDRVSDTPYERIEAEGCPDGRDTCPAPGDDPVHNYMDYSKDACMTEFTEGQGERMQAAWAAYRADPAR
ncbi:MAG: zinc metalloprotease [Streptosporangiales bacterium]|nr:zinc metalloprotease [Streptosporangiales bacterium]